MNIISEEIRSYIEKTILPLYENFDKAHQREHAERVIAESINLAQHYPTNLSMVYVIAAYHDVGLCKGRELHHLVSGTMLYADPQLSNWFSPEERLLMKEAVEDHRASNRHEPRSIYGKIVAEADRIIDAHITLQRTVQYGLSHYPNLTKEEHYNRLKEHIQNKYGDNGYLKLWIPESNNAAQLKAFRELIKDEERLRQAFNQIYQAETSDK